MSQPPWERDRRWGKGATRGQGTCWFAWLAGLLSVHLQNLLGGQRCEHLALAWDVFLNFFFFFWSLSLVFIWHFFRYRFFTCLFSNLPSFLKVASGIPVCVKKEVLISMLYKTWALFWFAFETFLGVCEKRVYFFIFSFLWLDSYASNVY